MRSQQRKSRPETSSRPSRRASQSGFTLLETSVALVIMMIVGLGAASLFFFASNYNSGASDRQLAMGVAQKRMEWLRNIPFNKDTRSRLYTDAQGGLAATGANGVTETFTNGGRRYSVVTNITDLGTDPSGNPTLKRITLRVTPINAGTSFGTVTLSTIRATVRLGTFD